MTLTNLESNSQHGNDYGNKYVNLLQTWVDYYFF